MVAEPLNLVPDESGPSVGGNPGGADSTKASRFNPMFTDSVIAATGPKANARLAQVMPSLLRHLHDFARENEITVDEWTAAVEMVCPLLPETTLSRLVLPSSSRWGSGKT